MSENKFKKTVLKTVEERTMFLIVGHYAENDDFYACKITDDYSGMTFSTEDKKESKGIENDGFLSIMNSDNFKEGLQDIIKEYSSDKIDEKDFELPEDLEYTEYLLAEVPEGEINIGYVDEDGNPLDIKADLDEYLMYGDDVTRFRDEAEDEDIEIEPIMFFPNGTKFKTGELTGNAYNEIAKAFIPYQRKKKIDTLMDIDRENINKIYLDVIETSNKFMRDYGTYNYFDKGMCHEVVYSCRNILDKLNKNELIELIKKFYDMDLEPFQSEKFSVLREYSDDVFKGIAESIIHGLDDREDFDEILESDSRFEY